jgi:predicted lysophospholipase L1 biosynthesis ABC-type transport system permease subunit
MQAIFDWVGSHESLLGWLSVASVLMFVGSLTAIPWLVVRIPTDYFLRQRHYANRWKPRHPLVRAAFLTLKNLFGIVLLVVGVAMLVLPGQGILTIVVGLIFLDFPGKFALEQFLVRRKAVHLAMNWILAKANRPPLERPDAPSR